MRKNGMLEEWNVGRMEAWKGGMLGMWRDSPVFRYSILPLLSLLLVSACTIIILAGCSREQADTSADSKSVPVRPPPSPAPGGGRWKPKSKPPLVYVENARQATIANVLDLTGTVEPASIARLASAAEGPVDSLLVREGDAVKAGDELVTIGRSTAAVADLAAANENMAKEKEEFRRVEKLVKSGAMSGDALDDAQSRLEQARAKVAQAEERNRDYRVQAPWAGLVSRVFVREGFYVAPRTPLLEMFDPQSLVVRFYVPEEASMQVELGMKVTLTLDAYPDRTFKAQLSRIYPELDSRTRTRTVEAEKTDDVELLKGMFARLSLAIETVEKAVIVPDAALISTPDGKTIVFVVTDGTVSRRVVETGIENGGRIQIVSGVKPGEQVAVRGNEKLKDGAAVRLPGKSTGEKTTANSKEESNL